MKLSKNPARDDIIIVIQHFKSYPNPTRGGIINKVLCNALYGEDK